MSVPIVVRPLTSQEEYELYFRMVDAAFSDSPSEEGTQLEVGSVCSILFPQGHTWMPGSDWF